MTPEPSSSVPTAEFGTRFSAFMADAAILFALQWIVVIVLSRQFQAVGLSSVEPCAPGAVQMCEGPSTPLWTLVLLFLVASTVAYHAVFDGLYGATPGKRLLGLTVVDEADRGPIGVGSGLVRSVIRQAFWLSLFFVFDASPFALPLPSVLFIAVPLLGLGLLATGAVAPDGRAVHDRVAKTRVVRMDQVPVLTAGTLRNQADIDPSAVSHVSPDERTEPEESL